MLTIILQTYQRTQYAITTIRAIKQNLDYTPGYSWIVADDGSDAAHVDAVRHEIGTDNVIALLSERVGYGALANWAWETSMNHSRVSLWLEDDWTLDRKFNPAHYISRLEMDPSIGIIRLARFANGLRGEIIGDGQECYLRLDHTPYYFSGNPSLRHLRFMQNYGAYPTGLNPGDTEIAYDGQIQEAPRMSDIVIPINIGTWGLFGHIGAEASYVP